jgi:hypothetical protein
MRSTGRVARSNGKIKYNYDFENNITLLEKGVRRFDETGQRVGIGGIEKSLDFQNNAVKTLCV